MSTSEEKIPVDATEDRRKLRSVRKAYTAAAENPGTKHPFPMGRDFAHRLGYPKDALESLPGRVVEAFTGVSTISLDAEISESDTVLDLGCGAGLDSLIAGRRTRADGRVLGIDFSQAMLRRALEGAAQLGMENVFFVQAEAERLPLADESIDAALANGIFNLNPGRAGVLSELHRVLRKGGRVHVAELILSAPLSQRVREDEANWFS